MYQDRQYDIGGFRFGPDEPAAGTPATTPAAASPAASATPTTTPSPSPAAAPAAGATTTPPAASAAATTPATTPPAATPSWLDGFRQAGVFGADVSEDAARQRLIQDARDAAHLRHMAPSVSEYQTHQAEFQEFLARRKEESAKTQANEDWTKKLGWTPPEFDPNWATQLRRDDQGNIVALPGAPSDLVAKYQRYEQWTADQFRKFKENPFKFMEPGIRHIAGEIAAQQAQQNVGSYRETVEANQFVEKHSDWLFERDAQGGVKTDQRFNPQTGRYDSNKVLSARGQMFVERLKEYGQQGLSPEMQQRFAFNDVRLAYMQSPEYSDYLLAERAKVQTPAAGTPAGGAAGATGTARQQANADFLGKTNPAVPPAPSAGGNTVPAPQFPTRHNLADVLLKKMREQGVTVQ